MAEGDTILRLARRIEVALAGSVVSVRTPHPRGRAAGLERLDGATLVSAAARGKHLLLTFRLPSDAPSSGGSAIELVLHSHLGMSGGWHLYRRGARWRRSENAAWAVLTADERGLDLVQFGGPTLRLLRPEQLRRDPALNSLGPDILAAGDSFDLAASVRSLRAADHDTTVGEALLDQSRVAGIGNIFKSEGCFAAALDPWRELGQVADHELKAVLLATREMMLACVEGTPRPRQVYRRAGEPCLRCGTAIRSRGQGDANRTTYWCPGCQK